MLGKVAMSSIIFFSSLGRSMCPEWGVQQTTCLRLSSWTLLSSWDEKIPDPLNP